MGAGVVVGVGETAGVVVGLGVTVGVGLGVTVGLGVGVLVGVFVNLRQMLKWGLSPPLLKTIWFEVRPRWKRGPHLP